ncbi:UNVERIFIED_CONTAM: hypothetical protein H355_000953 [Colinus virginianus]|nr:hypothetical protein H355_000953 [Colinus virginianus]
MGETEQRPTAGSRLGAQENAGISTLEHGQKPPMTPPGKLISIKIQMLDDTQETFDVPTSTLPQSLSSSLCLQDAWAAELMEPQPQQLLEVALTCLPAALAEASLALW